MAFRIKLFVGCNFSLRIIGLLAIPVLVFLEAISAPAADAPVNKSNLAVPVDAIPLSLSERVWIDKKNKRLLLDGEVCLQKGPLELLVCPWNGKLHESVVRIHSKPSTVHAGLLAIGGTPGAPVSYEDNEYKAAYGGIVDVILQWKDENGDTQEAHGQDWVRNRDRRADRKNAQHAEIIKRAEKSAEETNVIDGNEESYWTPVHPAFKKRVEKEAVEKERTVIRPSPVGKQIEQLMILSDPRVLNPDVPEPKKYYRTQFSPVEKDNPDHQELIQLATGKDDDDIRMDGRLRGRWEAVFPNQKDAIQDNKNNIVRSSPAGKQIEELIIRGQLLEHDWVFAGSKFALDPETNDEIYIADRSGEVICVSNFPTAMIDLPIESTSENTQLGFEAASENIPPKGTPVRLILVPHALKQEEKTDDE
jgi:hypothetical protein